MKKHTPWRFLADGGVEISAPPPYPWINYLSNGRYCAIISQRGGGYSFYKDPGKNRVSRWRPENYMADLPGRFVYVIDRANGEWFTLNGIEAGARAAKCVHRPGETSLSHSAKGVRVDAEYIVPPGDDVEIWSVRLGIDGKKKGAARRLRVVVAVLGG